MSYMGYFYRVVLDNLKNNTVNLHLCIYAFSRRFCPKRLIDSVCIIVFFYQYDKKMYSFPFLGNLQKCIFLSSTVFIIVKLHILPAVNVVSLYCRNAMETQLKANSF